MRAESSVAPGRKKVLIGGSSLSIVLIMPSAYLIFSFEIRLSAPATAAWIMNRFCCTPSRILEILIPFCLFFLRDCLLDTSACDLQTPKRLFNSSSVPRGSLLQDNPHPHSL